MRIQTRYRTIVTPPDLVNNPLHASLKNLEAAGTENSIPLTWERAEDFSVYDDHGNRYLDFTSGIFVTNAGHANPAIKKAIQAQLDANLLFSYNYPTRLRERFLRRLLELSPSHFEKVLLLMTGSEATDVAYKLIKRWGDANGRRYIITFRGAYHGRCLSCELLSKGPDYAAWSRVHDADIVFLDFPYEGGTFDPARLPPAREIAAFFLETFQGWGAWMYPPAYFHDLTRFAREAGALLCFDEMQAGFWRLGPIYGYLTYDPEVRPDLLCLGKAISSSLPIAAVLTTRGIADLDRCLDLHGTHSGNPLCVAAALANLDFLADPAFQAAHRERCQVFEGEMAGLAGAPLLQRVNARGMIAGLIFRETATATAVVHACIRRGMLPVCTNRESIKLAPPLTMPPDAIREGVQVLREALAEVAAAQPA